MFSCRKVFLGLCAGKNPQAWRALMMAWSLLNENSKWSVSLHFLELSVPVNAGCLDAGIPLLHVHSQNVSRKLWERVGVVSLDILGDKNTTKYITDQTFLPNFQKLGFLMWRAVQQPLPASCHATYRCFYCTMLSLSNMVPSFLLTANMIERNGFKPKYEAQWLVSILMT